MNSLNLNVSAMIGSVLIGSANLSFHGGGTLSYASFNNRKYTHGAA